MAERIAADENGWAVGRIEPLPIERAWSLLAAEPDARIDEDRWAHHAKRFFSLRIAIAPKKAYPTGASPIADAFDLEVASEREDESVGRVRVITTPLDRAPAVRSAALAIARGPAGGGFEALVLRAKRLWQIDAAEGSERAAVAAATVIASVLLAPILPPNEGVVFGVKTARERLSRLGREGR